ncbi:MAG: Holliday junction resolvase RuvX [Actinomycetota bacterium]|jgi:putative Holliday junction resolvase|nr:Holliday junction resolvase RuvX [Actinomycetota bacterium]
MRALGVDLGEQRVGLAVSDSTGVLASPYGVIERTGDPRRDRQALADIVAEVHAELVVVGMPLSMSGVAGKAALAAEKEAVALAAVVGVPVETFDERLTTVEAVRRRHERASLSPGDRRRGRHSAPALSRAAHRRSGLDAEAAAVMLAAWLDSRPR